MSGSHDTDRSLCMVVHSYYPVGEPRVEREVAAATRAGWDVTVIAMRRPEEPSTTTEADGVEIRRIDLQHVRGASPLALVREYVGFALRATLALATLSRARRLDVVHVHAPPDFLVFAALLPRLRGARILLDIHDLSPHLFGARFGGVWRRAAVPLLRFTQRAACGFADAVLTVHEPYREELVAAGVDRAKIQVVMNSPDPRLLPTRPGRRDDGRFVVAYHGTITEWYGVDLIVQAVAELAPEVDIHAVLLGEGDAVGSARELAAHLGVADRVRFSDGYLPITAALREVAAADCGAVPNRPTELNRFALSSKLLEYVNLRMPVAVARLPTLVAHFAEDEVWYFEPGNANALAGALHAIFSDRVAADQRAGRAFERARRYAWEENAARYVRTLSV